MADVNTAGGLEFLADVATIVGGVVAAAVILGTLWTLGGRWFGRRRDHYRRLRRLGVNAQLDFFTSVLGQPPAIRRSVTATVRVLASDGDDLVDEERTFQECIYVDPTYFVDALIDSDESVMAFAVTTRSKRFHPTLASAPKGSVPRLVVKLGVTRFSDLPITPDRLIASVGARRLWYGEIYYLGNPGHYLSFVCSVADSGYFRWEGIALPVDTANGEYDFDHRAGIEGDEAILEQPLIRRFRRSASMNTWAVVGGSFDPVHDEIPPRMVFGADHDHVRTLVV